MAHKFQGDCSCCKWAQSLPGELQYDYVSCCNEKSPVFYQVLFEHYNRCGVFEPQELTDEEVARMAQWDKLSDEAFQNTERSLQDNDIAQALGSSKVIPLGKKSDGPLGWMGLVYQIRDRLLRKQYYKENKREKEANQ